MKEKYDVTGMTCSACSSRVEKCVSKLEGVEEVSVNLLTNSMQVTYQEDVLDRQKIMDTVADAGYGAYVHGEGQTAEAQSDVSGKAPGADPVQEQLEHMKFRLIISFVFLIPLMYVSMGHMAGLPLPGFLTGMENAVGFAMTQFLLCLPVAYVNRAYYIKGFQTLRHGAPNMDSLIAVGSTASLAYGIFAIYRMGYGLGVGDMELVSRYHMDLYFESAVMILALINVGKYLEARSKGKTSEAITKLMQMAPKTAWVERDKSVAEVPVEQVQSGDIIHVKPGQSVPVDGVILEGSTSIDEAAITGESIPVQKSAGDSVISATMNKTGFIRFRATRVGNDTTFSQIIRLVEEASASKAPIAKIADRVAGIFVPVVMGISLVTLIVWLMAGAVFEFALSCAICVLVISCPCALGLATPVAIMVGTGKGAEHGILIKSGEALETAHHINSVVLDKTGTITRGEPEVTDIWTVHGTEEELLTIALALEEKSEHPLAEAVMTYGRQHRYSWKPAEDFLSIPGKGIEGYLDGRKFYSGNRKLMEDIGLTKTADWNRVLEKAEALADEGKTPLYFADEEKILGILAAADVAKPTSKAAVEAFKQLGIEVIMLTGDNKRTAQAIQKQLGIDTVIAEVLPQDKEREVSRLQAEGKKVAMIGDGINDAPALAKADVGMAIGAGTDVAMESADVVLMKNDLLDAVTAIRLSKAVIRNIKQNLFWAFFYNCLGIPLAAGVFYSTLGLKLSPMFGAAAMSLSSFFVVSNALRLRLFKVSKGEEETVIMQQENITQKEKETKTMITMKIEGMMCAHCKANVEKALNAIPGASAEVNLEKKAAYVTGDGLDKGELEKAVTEAGYEVISISE
ncbi:MAG: heavy metal translocating P-type ATPase [Lachnospiraceae bacterium]|jgi:heavy metal translocating P-type ATPase